MTYNIAKPFEKWQDTIYKSEREWEKSMEYYGKDPRPYRGIGFFALFLVLVPISIFFLVYVIFTNYNDSPKDVVFNFAVFLACLVGTLFNLIALFKGSFEDLLRAWRERLKEFFEEVRITPKGAFKSYFVSFYHDGGIILVIFFAWTIIMVVVGVITFFNVRAWYLTLDL